MHDVAEALPVEGGLVVVKLADILVSLASDRYCVREIFRGCNQHNFVRIIILQIGKVYATNDPILLQGCAQLDEGLADHLVLALEVVLVLLRLVRAHLQHVLDRGVHVVGLLSIPSRDGKCTTFRKPPKVNSKLEIEPNVKFETQSFGSGLSYRRRVSFVGG